MKELYIFAYPARMIALQLRIEDKLIDSKNCAFNDAIPTINTYIKNQNIDTIVLLGGTYADKLEQLIYSNFNGHVNIERA